MKVFRIAKEKYIASLTGMGAEIVGGRWNRTGIRAVYTASSRALAMAETLVQPGFEQIPETYHIAQINVPDELEIYFLDMSSFDPDDWRTIRHAPFTKRLGSEILQGNRFPLIKVPSIVVKGDFNYVLNPSHENGNKITVDFTEPFPFDDRLLYGKNI